MVTDNTGLTPAQLAADKNHRQVAFFLVCVSYFQKLCWSCSYIMMAWFTLYYVFSHAIGNVIHGCYFTFWELESKKMLLMYLICRNKVVLSINVDVKVFWVVRLNKNCTLCKKCNISFGCQNYGVSIIIAQLSKGINLLRKGNGKILFCYLYLKLFDFVFLLIIFVH